MHLARAFRRLDRCPLNFTRESADGCFRAGQNNRYSPMSEHACQIGGRLRCELLVRARARAARRIELQPGPASSREPPSSRTPQQQAKRDASGSVHMG
eukprot:4467205-Pyramimonas_sp.AAC.1